MLQDRELPLRPQSFAVLSYLVQKPGVLVSKKELLDAIWGKKAVTDDSLTHCLIDIRRAIGDDAHEMIRTVPRRGFIFELEVDETGVRQPALLVSAHRWQLVAIVALLIGSVAVWYALSGASDEVSPATEIVDELPTSSAAYDRYLQGKFIFDRRSPGDVERSVTYFQQAIELDAEFAPAWAALAGAYWILLNEGEIDPENGQRLLLQAAETAVGLDPDLPEGILRLATTYTLDGKQEMAEKMLRKVLAENPNNPLALGFAAGVAGRSGDLDKAIELQQRATTLDPLNGVNHGNLASFLAAAGRFDEAIQANRNKLNLNPAALPETDEQLAQLFILQGRYEDALDIIRLCRAGLEKDQGLALVFYGLGRMEEAYLAQERLVAVNNVDADIRLAEIYAHKGEYEASFGALQHVYDGIRAEMDSFTYDDYVTRVFYSPFLRPLHADRRWSEWLTSIQS